MIDTVILNIPFSDYTILNPERFSPSTDYLNQYCFTGKKFVNNYTNKDKYYPRLTIIPRKNKEGSIVKDLRVEFSVAKLIYLNNLQELLLIDERLVYQTLIKRLGEMGVKIVGNINKAKVSGFDIGKNIVLEAGTYSNQIISELNKCSLDRRLDLDNKEYREGSGNTLQFYSKSHAFVFYNKLADINKSKSRSTDKNKTNNEKEMGKNLFNEEILRVEIRIRSRVKLKQILKKNGVVVDIETFEDLFNEQLWKMFLNYYWKSLIIDKNQFIFNAIKSSRILIKQMKKFDPDIKVGKICALLGAYYVTKEIGVNEFRQIYEYDMQGKNWSKFKKELDVLNEITDIDQCFKWFKDLDSILSF